MTERYPRDPGIITGELHALWQRDIPLAEFMDVSIARLDGDGIAVNAPLAANSNHLGTAFGGSLQSVAILAGWGIVYALLDEPAAVHVVIRRCTMEFIAPVNDDFTACCALPEAATITRFRRLLDLRGRAKLNLEIDIRQQGNTAATCNARYVVAQR